MGIRTLSCTAEKINGFAEAGDEMRARVDQAMKPLFRQLVIQVLRAKDGSGEMFGAGRS